VSHVLITSISKKVPLIKCVKNASSRLTDRKKVFGADIDPSCVGRYFVEEFWEMPRLDELPPEDLIAYCQKQEINSIIPTRDGELLYFSKHSEQLRQHGIHVMTSCEESVRIACDKVLFYNTLREMKIAAIETYNKLSDFESPHCVSKERYGAGSSSIGIRLSKKDAEEHARSLNHPVFQPYIEGKEISVDLYIDRSGHAKGVILRYREKVVEGESQVTTTFRDEHLEVQCVRLAEDLNLYGHVMFQLIQQENLPIRYFLECNARFGGASTLSLAAGLDSFYWFFQEVDGCVPSCFQRAPDEKTLVRHAEDLIL